MTAVTITANQSEDQETKPTIPDLYVAIAQRDPKVAKALRLLGFEESSWPSLYKIFEVIQSDVGGKMYENGWIIEAKGDLFTQTANSSLAIGDEARHGHEKVPAPPKPMPLAEAKSLIKTLLERWMDSKKGAVIY